MVIRVLLLLCFLFPAQAGWTEVSLSAQDRTLVRELEPLLKGTRGFNYLPHEVVYDKKYGPAWLYLADTAKDPKVAALALQGVAKLYTPNPSAGAKVDGKPYDRLLMTDQVKDVVCSRLGVAAAAGQRRRPARA